MEVCVVRKDGSVFLEESVLDKVVKQIEEESGEKKGSIPASAP
jgi:hypothetical protein